MNRRIKTGQKSYRDGRLAERLAALTLMLKGYRILGQRLRSGLGEIDILAGKGDTLVVVEVKKRNSEMQAAEALGSPQRRQLLAAGSAALARHGNWAKHLRFDVILLAPYRLPRHIKNAFS